MIASGQQPTNLIEAVGDLWKLSLVVSIFIVVLIFRKQIADILNRLTRLRGKWRDAEIVVEQTPAADTAGAVAGAIAQPEADIDTEDAPDQQSPVYAMFLAFNDERFDDACSAFEDWQNSEPDEQKRIENEAYYLSQRHQLAADESAIPKLKELAEQPGPRGQILYCLGVCYRYSNDYVAAATAFRQAMDVPDSADDYRARFAASLAHCIAKIDGDSEALAFLSRHLPETTTAEGTTYLYRAIASVAESLGDKRTRALALEKVVELNPADVRARFDAALVQSEADLPYLCISNYNTILRFQAEHRAALNNLAVEYERLDIKTRSVALYRQAAGIGGTLPMANLAYRYLAEGFADDAVSTLETAGETPDPHANVGAALVAVAKSQERDKKASEEAIDLGDKQQHFLRSFADAYFLPCDEGDVFAGVWQDSDGTQMEILQQEKTIAADWGGEDLRWKLTGEVRNRSADVLLKRTGVGTTLVTALLSKEEKGFAYVSADGSELQLMTAGRRGTFRRFARVVSS